MLPSERIEEIFIALRKEEAENPNLVPRDWSTAIMMYLDEEYEKRECAPDCKEREQCIKAGLLGHWACGYCESCKIARHHCEHFHNPSNTGS